MFWLISGFLHRLFLWKSLGRTPMMITIWSPLKMQSEVEDLANFIADKLDIHLPLSDDKDDS
jgi:hypothetical protein